MNHSSLLEQTRTNVLLLRKDNVMNSIEATTIIDIIDRVVFRLGSSATATAKATHTADAVNVLTIHFPFKARGTVTHDKGIPHEAESVPPDLLFFRDDKIVVTGEYDSKYWLGSLHGRSGKVPKDKVERVEKEETVLSYRAEAPTTIDNPPAYTVSADPTLEDSTPLENPRLGAPPEPPRVSATQERPRVSMAPVAGPSTGPSLNPPIDASSSAYDRNSALSRNVTLPPRTNRDSRPDVDLRRHQSAQPRRPSPQPALSQPPQQFNQRYSQMLEPSSPSFAPAPHWQDQLQPSQPYDQRSYGQRPSSYHAPDNYQYAPQVMPAQHGPGSSSYSQYPGEPSMPMPSVPGAYNSSGPSSPFGGVFPPNI